MEKLTQLVKSDMKPALGVTEPGAIAYAAATARTHVNGAIELVSVRLNSGMYKNAFTCGIPNSDESGNLFAAALGVVAGDASLGLEALAHIASEDNHRAAELIRAGKVEVILDHMGSAITIDTCVRTTEDTCMVRIADSHTGIYEIIKNGKIIFEKERVTKTVESNNDIHEFTFHDIISYVNHVMPEEIAFIESAFTMNMELLNAGLASSKTTFGPRLLVENNDRIFSKDALRTAQLLCNGAIEARVLGIDRPAMSITGSGAHGIIAVMPLLAYYHAHKDEMGREQLLGAAALSYLITMYIKEYSGKLSAFCGCGIAAGTGMACGLALMQGAKKEELAGVIRNMASSVTGMICDGGNQGCVMKGIVAVDAAFRSVEMAMAGAHIGVQHGINGMTPEETMKNMGLVAVPGMTETEKVIVGIMQKK